ncbi:MAG: hypothetical protein HEP80_20575 [Dolichospermum sp. UKL201]|nr:hypothetical protein [Dolichospermum circinale]MDB9450372.1 hypothetical protein [Dolichospermum circinale CS-547]QSV55890.1 MAG: hypothetical protein HEP80_20575 [Dolichospermum sp. UKL201]
MKLLRYQFQRLEISLKSNQQAVQVATSGYLHCLFWQFLKFDGAITQNL